MTLSQTCWGISNILTHALLTVLNLKVVITDQWRRNSVDFVFAVFWDPHTEVANRKIWMRGITFKVDRSARTACSERGKQNRR